MTNVSELNVRRKKFQNQSLELLSIYYQNHKNIQNELEQSTSNQIIIQEDIANAAFEFVVAMIRSGMKPKAVKAAIDDDVDRKAHPDPWTEAFNLAYICSKTESLRNVVRIDN
jgi:hypothetical protein